MSIAVLIPPAEIQAPAREARTAVPAVPQPTRVVAIARRRRLVQSGRSVVLWAGMVFVLSQLVVGMVAERWLLSPYEAIWRQKREQLRTLAAREPDRSLVVMLGSSRTDSAFQAGRLNGLTGPDGRPVVGYNLGIPAAGPLHEWLFVRTLLDRGIRPRLLLVEFLPPMLNQPRRNGGVSEEGWYATSWVSASDLVHLWPYLARPRKKGYEWLEARLAPAYGYRADLHTWLKKQRHPDASPPDRVQLPSDDWGYLLPGAPPPPDRCRREVACKMWAPTLEQIQPGRGPCQALHDLLARCRREGIPAALVIMPESSFFRSWYSPRSRAAVQRVLAELRAVHGTPVIDANQWLDDDDFFDGHHVLERGADKFTARLRVEVQRLLAEKAD